VLDTSKIAQIGHGCSPSKHDRIRKDSSKRLAIEIRYCFPNVFDVENIVNFSTAPSEKGVA